LRIICEIERRTNPSNSIELLGLKHTAAHQGLDELRHR
jgi:hypothetical protein